MKITRARGKKCYEQREVRPFLFSFLFFASYITTGNHVKLENVLRMLKTVKNLVSESTVILSLVQAFFCQFMFKVDI